MSEDDHSKNFMLKGNGELTLEVNDGSITNLRFKSDDGKISKFENKEDLVEGKIYRRGGRRIRYSNGLLAVLH